MIRNILIEDIKIMARIRSIKPEFFHHEQMAGLTAHSRLLAIALWQLADCEGRILNIPMQIHAHAFPWEPELNLKHLMSELETIHMIRTYQIEHKSYIEVCNFKEHQRLQGKEATMKSKLPAYNKSAETNKEIKDEAVEPKKQAIEKPVIKKPKKKEKIALAPMVDVHDVFDYWKEVLDHPRAVLDDKRTKLIKKQLSAYSITDLKMAIKGCSLTPYNMGDNTQKTRYDSIGLILRDADHIDRFIKNENEVGEEKRKLDAWINGDTDKSIVATQDKSDDLSNHDIPGSLIPATIIQKKLPPAYDLAGWSDIPS